MSSNSQQKIAMSVALKTLIVCSFEALRHSETYITSLERSNIHGKHEKVNECAEGLGILCGT